MCTAENRTMAEPSLSTISRAARKRCPPVHVNERMREYYKRQQLRLQNDPELLAKHRAMQRAKYMRWMTRIKTQEPARWQQMKERGRKQSREYQRRRWLRLHQLLQKYNEEL